MFSTERAVICGPRKRKLRIVSLVRDNVRSVWMESEDLLWIRVQIFQLEGQDFHIKEVGKSTYAGSIRG